MQPPKKIISEAIEKVTPIFAAIAKKAPKVQPIKIAKKKISPKIQHLAVIRPVNEQNTSANTKSFVQKERPRGTNWVLEIAPSLFPHLPKVKKVNTGWESLHQGAYKTTTMLQMWLFGHLAKNCKEEKESCTNCCSKYHSWRSCTEPAKCINSSSHNIKHKTNLDTSHSCKAKSCPAYEKEIKFIINRTNYGQ
ncbi:hypothetical protein CEXT_759821 [Caerostris extrusa]|uniref:Uncharacterized protein n=1 Tax=Caerostris extrusa TaxID=172846 RepID=A0AAV4MI63_CAEEX|nr:hypothetical protein CEXT_759821 [Caerostris extrusa]